MEKVLVDVSGAKWDAPTPLNPDHIMQQASLINRNKDDFVQCAKDAGIKIVTKFDIKDVAALKAELPWE